MASKSDDVRNGLVSIVCSLVFVVLTVLVPFLRVIGGFLKYSTTIPYQGQDELWTMDFHWNNVIWGWLGLFNEYTYPDWLELKVQRDEALSLEVIWQIIPFWGFVWIALGVLGAVLVVIPAVQKIFGQQSSKIWIIGIVLGFIGTIVEYGLFIVLWLLEDWKEPSGPEINLLLLGCFIIGWVAFIIGAFFVRKPTFQR
jgi:hypothetical protein